MRFAGSKGNKNPGRLPGDEESVAREVSSSVFPFLLFSRGDSIRGPAGDEADPEQDARKNGESNQG